MLLQQVLFNGRSPVNSTILGELCNMFCSDSTPHIKDNVASHDMYRDILTNITRELKEVFNSTTVYAAFGNHDYYPGHQFPPNNNDMYNEIYEEWKDWINDEQQKANFQKGIVHKYILMCLFFWKKVYIEIETELFFCGKSI